MPIPLGILAAAGFRAAGGSYEHIETYTVGAGGIASVTFNVGSYSTTYQHLQIRTAVRSARAGNLGSALSLRVNADTGSNYAWHYLLGDGSTVTSSAAASTNNAQVMSSIPAANATANAFAGGVIDILDPYETKNKTIRTHGGVTPNNYVFLTSILWNNTASVSSLTLYDTTGANLAQYSRFSIYGLRSS